MFCCHAAYPDCARNPLSTFPSLWLLTADSSPIMLANSSWATLLLDQRFFRRVLNRDQRLRVIGPAVAIQKVVNVGTGALQSTIARRNVHLQLVHAVGRLGALIHLHPDAGLLGDHLALAVRSAATRSIAHVLRARHRADVFHQA